MKRIPLLVEGAWITLVFLALGSCAPLRAPTFAELTATLTVTTIETKNHHILAISNEVLVEKQPHVNIYLKGDGQSWLNRRTISEDPTPRYPLALDLMARDSDPAFYLTRPCYYRQPDPNCNEDLWTYGRYSQEVVDTLVEALNVVLASMESRPQVTLIGYSGGATLALLMANEIPEVDQVVTVAGNLDTEAWTDFHSYTPLHRSLNPAKLSLRKDVRYLHYVGAQDRNIPPDLGHAVYTQPGHKLIVIDDWDHRCCWVEHWPGLLEDAEKLHETY